MGFPSLERLVEQDSYDEFNKVMLESYDELEKIIQSKGGDAMRRKAAKKAMRAMELTMNLLRDFLQVKDELMRNQKGSK